MLRDYYKVYKVLRCAVLRLLIVDRVALLGPQTCLLVCNTQYCIQVFCSVHKQALEAGFELVDYKGPGDRYRERRKCKRRARCSTGIAVYVQVNTEYKKY